MRHFSLTLPEVKREKLGIRTRAESAKTRAEGGVRPRNHEHQIEVLNLPGSFFSGYLISFIASKVP
jgi:hypothetical protein